MSADVYRGVFINLSRNEKRRAALRRRLKEATAVARYRRVEAVDGRAVAGRFRTELSAGELGLWLTHEAIVRAHRTPDRHLRIIEDDIVLAKRAPQLFERVLGAADARSSWDLLFTDVHVPLSVGTFRLLAEKVDRFARSGDHALVDLRRIRFASASSVFINKRSLSKYARLIEGKWLLGIPIDLFLRQLVHRGVLRAYVTVPFLTSLAEENNASDVWGTARDRSRRVCDVVRRSFFQEADHRVLLAEMRALTKNARRSDLAELFVQAESFALSDEWTPF